MRSPVTGKWLTPELHGNLDGWIQYRKSIPGEHAPESWEAPLTWTLPGVAEVDRMVPRRIDDHRLADGWAPR